MKPSPSNMVDINSIVRSLLLSTLMPLSSLHGQDYCQRFSVREILYADSDLNQLLTEKTRERILNPSTTLFAVRLDADPRQATYLWIRNKAARNVEPFGEQNYEKMDLEIQEGPLSKGFDEQSWKPYNDLGLLKLISLSLSGQSNQEKNYIKMSGLGDERKLHLYLRQDGLLRGGKIINPEKGTRTHKIIGEFHLDR